MRDRVALACLGGVCLVSIVAAVFNLAWGDYAQFWWYLAYLCLFLVLLARQFRHVRRQNSRPDDRP
jgi:4-hydroxybenzoate polyprenyltransferase